MSRSVQVVFFSFCVAVGVAMSGCGGDQPGSNTGGGGGGGPGIIPGGSGGSGGGDGGSGGTGGEGGIEEPAPFEIDSVQPPRGPLHGTTRVIITGKGFMTSVPDELRTRDSTLVLFDDNPAMDTRVVDDRTIFATSPAGVVGHATVAVRNPVGEEVCERCFRYLAPLDLVSVEPGTGPVEGGTTVILRGEGLTDDMVVTFGGRAALEVEELEDGSLSAILPEGSGPGLVDVRVVGDNGNAVLRRGFAYRDELRIEGIHPPGSPLAGGISAMITGTGFTTATRVYFGETEVPATLLDNDLEVVVPAGTTDGPMEVKVVSPTGSASFPFAYYNPGTSSLALHTVTPARGPVSGGAMVSLVGSGFDPTTMAVYFGDKVSPSVTVDSAFIAHATTPPGAEGSLDVRIRTSEGLASLEKAYRYLPTFEITKVTPDFGPVEGGTPIVIEGVGFPAEPRVTVGALEAKEVVRVSESRIEAKTPVGSDGAVKVVVSDKNDPSSRAVLPGAFVYQGALSLIVIDPPTGSRAGGTTVLLRGTGFRGTMDVTFGETPAEEVTLLDPFTLQVTTPSGNDGFVDVRVAREDGEEAMISSGFSYFNPSSADGGASGGPLSGTLNVTALIASGDMAGGPIPDCDVDVGADALSMLHKVTDERGQATFSSPSLVKAVTVSVSCEGFEAVTVVNQSSENLTVRMTNFVPAPPPPPPDEGELPEQVLGIAGGRVYGFKLPPNRQLQADEEEVAFVTIAYPHVYYAPPLGGFNAPVIEVTKEGGLFSVVFEGPFHYTFFARYGIRNTSTGEFEPLLFGYSKGVALAPGEENYDTKIVLDTRLEGEVPVTIQNPPKNRTGSVEVTALLDLDGDGMIPISIATNSDDPTQALLKGMPNVSGESLLFFAVGNTFGGPPYTVAFRRQAGNIDSGITVGPMLGTQTFVSPAFPFFGPTIEWVLDPSPVQPDLIYIEIFEPRQPLLPDLPLWHAVLPGNETMVTIPPSVMNRILANYPFPATLAFRFVTGTQPRFDFDQWGYVNTSLANMTSFTTEAFLFFPGAIF